MKECTLQAQNCKMIIRQPDLNKDGTSYGVARFYVDDIEVEEGIFRLAIEVEKLWATAESAGLSIPLP